MTYVVSKVYNNNILQTKTNTFYIKAMTFCL